jgi:hypothetical protein
MAPAVLEPGPREKVMAKSKTVFMPEAEIQAYERLLEGELIADEKLPREFERLLRSYRLAANVANTAWAVVKNLDEAPEWNDDLDPLVGKLREALSDYAPKHFPRVTPQQVSALQEMYNELSQRSDVPPSFLDYFFDAIMGLQG